jgi:hypothetical protein
MKCVICGIEVESIEDAIDQGWVPYFYDGQDERGPACSECSETLLGIDENGDLELKEQYQCKISYKENFFHGASEERILICIAIENAMQSILN